MNRAELDKLIQEFLDRVHTFGYGRYSYSSVDVERVLWSLKRVLQEHRKELNNHNYKFLQKDDTPIMYTILIQLLTKIDPVGFSLFINQLQEIPSNMFSCMQFQKRTITFPEVKTVHENAFAGSNVEKLVFPKLASCSPDAFIYCSDLETISVPSAIYSEIIADISRFDDGIKVCEV